jgi:hypothetical protein
VDGLSVGSLDVVEFVAGRDKLCSDATPCHAVPGWS